MITIAAYILAMCGMIATVFVFKVRFLPGRVPRQRGFEVKLKTDEHLTPRENER